MLKAGLPRSIVLPSFAAAVMSCLIVMAYWPSFGLFVGTDLGVYWEVSRRLFQEGRLALGENYWDHKPPGVYFVLLPWHALTSARMEFLGLKVGTLVAYVTSFLIVGFALLRAGGEQSVWRSFGVFGIVAAAAASTLDARLDPVQNGLPSVLALCCEAAGLGLLAAAIREQGSRGLAVGAGVLLASAPFFRPTSSIGGLILACAFAGCLIARCVRGRPACAAGPVLSATGAAAVTVVVWFGAVCLLGTPLSVFWETVVLFNVRYGAHFRALTPVGDFFRQDSTAYWLLRGGLLLMMIQFTSPGLNRERRGAAMVGWAGAAYVALAVAAAVESRKIQSFYVFQFSLPVLFGAAIAVGMAPARIARWAGAAALGGWVVAVLIVWRSLSYVGPVVAGSDFASNQRMQTGAIVGRLADLSKEMPGGARLWVFGNRAPLYQAAALAGIGHRDWTVYDTPVHCISEERYNRWWTGFVADPPEFIVRLGNSCAVPWEPAERAGSRCRALESMLAEKYDLIETPAGERTTWPYGYTFLIYRRRV